MVTTKVKRGYRASEWLRNLRMFLFLANSHEWFLRSFLIKYFEKTHSRNKKILFLTGFFVRDHKSSLYSVSTAFKKSFHTKTSYKTSARRRCFISGVGFGLRGGLYRQSLLEQTRQVKAPTPAMLRW